MKKSFIIGLMVLSVIAVMSCGSDRPSYAEMLKREERAIDRLFDERGFALLKRFPDDSVFKANEFYKLESDVYLNIVDKGDDRRAVQFQTEILARFIMNVIMMDTTGGANIASNYGPNSNGTFPVQFKYGSLTAISQSISTALQTHLEGRLSEGMQEGLKYVGHGGKVKLIVPFKVGASDDQSNGSPIFYEIMEYKFME